MFEVILFLHAIIVFLFLFYFYQMGQLASPQCLFVFVNFIMFIGSFGLLSENCVADNVNCNIMFWGNNFFIFGCLFRLSREGLSQNKIRAFFVEKLIVEEDRCFNNNINLIVVFSLFVGVVYYYMVGYNIFIKSLFSLFSGGGVLSDVTSLRLASYSGDRYFMPGYVNQFKNIILPVCCLFFLCRYLIYNKKKDKIYLFFLVPCSFVFLLGTGQRGAFVVVVLILMITIFSIYPKKTAKKYFFCTAVLAFIVFLVASLFLGRYAKSFDGFETIGTLVLEFKSRIFNSNQISSVVGFRYIYTLPVQWGHEWLEGFLGVLPSRPGSDLAHRVFEVLYGSKIGTAPISIWGSIYHNFNYFGIITFPFFLGIFYQSLYLRMIKGRKSLFRVLCYCAIFVVLGTWSSGSPVQLLNKGFFAPILLYYFVRKAFRGKYYKIVVPEKI